MAIVDLSCHLEHGKRWLVSSIGRASTSILGEGSRSLGHGISRGFRVIATLLKGHFEVVKVILGE